MDIGSRLPKRPLDPLPHLRKGNGGALFTSRSPNKLAAAPPRPEPWSEGCCSLGGGARRRSPAPPARIGCSRGRRHAIGRPRGRGGARVPQPGGGGSGQSPGSCCGGDGRTDPWAPRGRCGPEGGQEREGLGNRSRAASPQTHTRPSSGGSGTGRGPGHAPHGAAGMNRRFWRASPENFLSFLIGKMEMIEKSPPRGC